MNRIVSAAVAGFAAIAMTASLGGIGPAFAQDSMKDQMKEKTVTVGGAPMYPSKNIVQNAVNSKDHTTLVAAVKAAGLVPTLESPGPFTVFAPTNEAFAKLPKGTVEDLLKPENKDKLVLHDENEGVATVTIADVKQSNGVIHVIDHVLLPK